MNSVHLSQNRLCLSCSKPVKGRSDKKFCDDYCRNSFNNRLKCDDGPLVRTINNILARNRRILASTIKPPEETARATKSRLLEKGFSFRYFTHTYVNKKGTTYFFCYDHGYFLQDNDWVFIVKRKQRSFWWVGRMGALPTRHHCCTEAQVCRLRGVAHLWIRVPGKSRSNYFEHF